MTTARFHWPKAFVLTHRERARDGKVAPEKMSTDPSRALIPNETCGLLAARWRVGMALRPKVLAPYAYRSQLEQTELAARATAVGDLETKKAPQIIPAIDVDMLAIAKSRKRALRRRTPICTATTGLMATPTAKHRIVHSASSLPHSAAHGPEIINSSPVTQIPVKSATDINALISLSSLLCIREADTPKPEFAIRAMKAVAESAMAYCPYAIPSTALDVYAA